MEVRRLINDYAAKNVSSASSNRESRKCSTTAEVAVFPCAKWLAKDEDDGAIERTLEADQTLVETVSMDVTTYYGRMEQPITDEALI